MSALGITGLTAYFGMLEVGHPPRARLWWCRRPRVRPGVWLGNSPASRGRGWSGITGSDAKNEILVERLGFDAAVNYRSDTFRKDLRAQCPSGVDVYFDNVGGGSSRVN
jgi:hypothetical protein